MSQPGGDEHYGSETRHTDEQHGQDVRQTDEFGNQVHSGTTDHHQGADHPGSVEFPTGLDTDFTPGGRSYQGLHTEPAVGGTTESFQNQPSAGTEAAYGGVGTGTGNSSSSEDDGEGGRRKKKGVMQKIKEKLPGGHGTDQQQETTGETQEKKGMMEKIKEKLPGSHK